MIKHNVIELQGHGAGSPLAMELAMSGPRTVAVQSEKYPNNYDEVVAAEGPECNVAGARYQDVFLRLGLEGQCLLITRTAKRRQNALILRVLHEHAFKRGHWAELFVVDAKYDRNERLGYDNAWMIEITERLNGRERLLGRVASAEINGKLRFWPQYPEVQMVRTQQRELKTRQRLAPYKWSTPRQIMRGGLYYPVELHSRALIARALPMKFDLPWLGNTDRDAGRIFEEGKKLFFAFDAEGEGLMVEAVQTVRKNSKASTEAKALTTGKLLSVGMQILSASPRLYDHSAVHRWIMRYVEPDDLQKLMLKMAQNAFVDKIPGAVREFHQAQRYFPRMTAPLPEHICKSALERLLRYERLGNYQFKLCS